MIQIQMEIHKQIHIHIHMYFPNVQVPFLVLRTNDCTDVGPFLQMQRKKQTFPKQRQIQIPVQIPVRKQILRVGEQLENTWMRFG